MARTSSEADSFFLVYPYFFLWWTLMIITELKFLINDFVGMYFIFNWQVRSTFLSSDLFDCISTSFYSIRLVLFILTAHEEDKKLPLLSRRCLMKNKLNEVEWKTWAEKSSKKTARYWWQQPGLHRPRKTHLNALEKDAREDEVNF